MNTVMFLSRVVLQYNIAQLDRGGRSADAPEVSRTPRERLLTKLTVYMYVGLAISSYIYI